MVAGKEASPKDAQNTERLMRYWASGPGAALVMWGTPGDYDRCVARLSSYVGPDVVHGLCENLHERATGMSTAEHAKMVRDAEARNGKGGKP